MRGTGALPNFEARHAAMEILSQLTKQCESDAPDGRPLYSYSFTPEQYFTLQKVLKTHISSSSRQQHTAAAFVFWASEYIRANFKGGPLTWEFVFRGISCLEDQDLGRDLTSYGLQWWGRNTRVSGAGHRMFLYSLMAEGGLPESLLQNQGLYRDVVLGILKEIEREGGVDAGGWAYDIALRWVQRLPQTFNTKDVGRLLAELALVLVDLRADLPTDLPESAAVPWLNQYAPDWHARIPLRMTQDVAESLIHPVLRAERTTFGGSFENLCHRELMLGHSGQWHGYLDLHDDAWLPNAMFPDAEGLRIRLIPTGENPMQGVIFSGTPTEDGWQLHRFGSVDSERFPFPPQASLSLTAFADGRPVGEAVVDPGISEPDESPTFWRAVDPKDGAHSSRLVPVVGEKRTRGACLWVWAPEGVDPRVEGEVRLEDIDDAPNGYLWRISGKGTLFVGSRRFRIHTGSEIEGIDAWLFATGKTLPGWRLDGKTPVFQGGVTFYGKRGASRHSPIPKVQLHLAPANGLFAQVAEWVQQEETLATCNLVCIPDQARLELRETTPGCIILEADGFDSAKRIKLAAGSETVHSELTHGAVTLILDAKGVPPGTVEVTLSNPETGAALTLRTTWPSRKGLIVGPDDKRLEQNSPLSVESLYGWRAITPSGQVGELQLHLQGHRAIAIPVASECLLAAHRPLVQAMLAQGGPDAQVNLSLVVAGDQSKRLELRRYQKKASIENGKLQTGLDWNKPAPPISSLGAEIKKNLTITFHAVNMSDPESCKSGETSAIVTLTNLLGESSDPWLIQTRYDGQPQRPVVWGALSQKTRKDRIENYKIKLRQLLGDGENNEWQRLKHLISAAWKGGDAGVLDEVQALAGVPAAALSLALRGGDVSRWCIQEIDVVAPIFWPSIPITEFEMAVRCEHDRLTKKLLFLYEDKEATETADEVLLRRIGQVLILLPELAAHFGSALVNIGIFNRFLLSQTSSELLQPFIISNPVDRLEELAQHAVKRFVHLPAGIQGLELENRPLRMQFNRYAQVVVDAPLVAVQMAAGLRPQPNLEEKLALINLRAVDPLYFDKALPIALTLAQAEPST